MVERAAPRVLRFDSHLPQHLPYRVSEHEQLLKRFRNRTAFTVSDGKRLNLYQSEIISLARLVRTPLSLVAAAPSYFLLT